MKINKALLVIAGLMLFAWGLGATPDVVKNGIVDLEQAVTSTEEGKAAREEFERKMRAAQAQLQPMIDQYQEMLADVESKKFVLSDSALREKQLDLVERQNEIRNKQQEIKGQLEIDRERLISPMRDKLQAVISEIGRRENFSLIMLRSAPGVIYTREALDITDLVIETFNKQG